MSYIEVMFIPQTFKNKRVNTNKVTDVKIKKSHKP